MSMHSNTVCRQCVRKVLHDSMKQPGCFSLEAMIAQRCEQQECDFFFFLFSCSHINVDNLLVMVVLSENDI